MVTIFDGDLHGDLHGGQRSSEVNCGKLCAMATKLDKKNRGHNLKDADDLHEGQRSTEVKIINNALWLPNLVRRTAK